MSHVTGTGCKMSPAAVEALKGRYVKKLRRKLYGLPLFTPLGDCYDIIKCPSSLESKRKKPRADVMERYI